MKKLLCSLLLVLAAQFSLHAKGDYDPFIKMVGKTMDLRTEKTLEEFSKQLTAGGFKDITEVLKPKVKNVVIMEGTNKGMTTTFELYHLPDGRIYELVMSMDGDKDNKQPVDVKMMVQKIAFNNVSNSLYKELGSPTIKEMTWDAPYTQADWNDDERTAAALKSNKLFVFFGYVSSKYNETDFKDEPSVYITLDPLLRVRMGVKDVELFKLLKPESSNQG